MNGIRMVKPMTTEEFKHYLDDFAKGEEVDTLRTSADVIESTCLTVSHAVLILRALADQIELSR